MEELKIKSLFMAQYLGQKVSYGERRWTLVYSYRGEDKDKTIDLETAIGIGCALELRSVSDLTDEEAIVLARFVYGDKIVSYSRACQAIIYVKVKLDQGVRARYITGKKLSGQQTDYLRAIGILIPFTFISDGKPITLSTEDIIKRGWAITTKNELSSNI